MSLTSAQKRELKARAHSLSAIIQTGGKGVTEAIIAETDQAIEHHELIKVRLAGAERDERAEMAVELAAAVKAEIVSTIGAVVILYRPSKTLQLKAERAAQAAAAQARAKKNPPRTRR